MESVKTCRTLNLSFPRPGRHALGNPDEVVKRVLALAGGSALDEALLPGAWRWSEVRSGGPESLGRSPFAYFVFLQLQLLNRKISLQRTLCKVIDFHLKCSEFFFLTTSYINSSP